jgi:hypothetical protein
MSVLFGFNDHNFLKKNEEKQKTANSLLPFSYSKFATEVPILNRWFHFSENFPAFHENCVFDTETTSESVAFVNAPPHDVAVTDNGRTDYFESKVCLFKGDKTELILRQDCYSFNCLQNILTHNPSARYNDLRMLLEDQTLVETPYMFMLLWKKERGIIVFDQIVFTDVAILQMIDKADTARTRASTVLINKALAEFAATGKMTYKQKKADTVPHQKLSLFPLRDVEILKTRIFTFQVKSTDLVLQHIQPELSLFHEIEKSKLVQELNKGLDK